MNLRQLQYFYDAAQTENLAKVSEKHMIPASSVSVAIKHLEEELGTPLFDRYANKIKLNEKGRLFAAEVGLALSRIDTATRQINKSTETRLPIKVLIRARPKWITELIAQFQAENPKIRFVICNDYALRDIDGFDIIIDEDAAQYSAYDRFLLSTEIICIKASADSPLVHKTLRFCDLKDEAFILPCQGNGMRRLYERTCKQHGITPNVAIECNDRQCMQYYVQANMGLTLGAYRALDDHTQDHIAPLTVTDFNAVQSVYVFYREDARNTGAIKSFCDFLYKKRFL